MQVSVHDQKLVSIVHSGDDRGDLCVIEGGRDANFPIRRVYYIYGTRTGVARGFHAHKALHQLAICVAGRCTMILDDGRERREVVLDQPNQGLLIGPMVWREMHNFSDNAVLMVLADQHYVETDYIRDYDAFLALARAS